MTIEIDLDKIERECAERRFFSSLVVGELVRRLREEERDAARYREALAVAQQANAEMYHAHTNPAWFTNGQRAATQHFITWSRKLKEATDAAMGELK